MENDRKWQSKIDKDAGWDVKAGSNRWRHRWCRHRWNNRENVETSTFYMMEKILWRNNDIYRQDYWRNNTIIWYKWLVLILNIFFLFSFINYESFIIPIFLKYYNSFLIGIYQLIFLQILAQKYSYQCFVRFRE